MSEPKRIQRQRTKGWRMPEGAVYVGRPTKWGNPRKVGHMVTVGSGGRSERRGMTAAEVADFFRVDLRNGLLERITVADVVGELAGRDLACWCPLDQPCHADECDHDAPCPNHEPADPALPPGGEA